MNLFKIVENYQQRIAIKNNEILKLYSDIEELEVKLSNLTFNQGTENLLLISIERLSKLCHAVFIKNRIKSKKKYFEEIQGRKRSALNALIKERRKAYIELYDQDNHLALLEAAAFSARCLLVSSLQIAETFSAIESSIKNICKSNYDELNPSNLGVMKAANKTKLMLKDHQDLIRALASGGFPLEITVTPDLHSEIDNIITVIEDTPPNSGLPARAASMIRAMDYFDSHLEKLRSLNALRFRDLESL